MTPPVSLDAEREILGTLLVYYFDGKAVHIVQSAGLLAEDLYLDKHRAVYRAVLRLHKQGDHVDTVTVGAFLREHRWLDRVGGMAFLEVLAAHHVVNGLRERAAIVHADGVARRCWGEWHDGRERLLASDLDGFRRAAAKALAECEPKPSLRVVEGEAA